MDTLVRSVGAAERGAPSDATRLGPAPRACSPSSLVDGDSRSLDRHSVEHVLRALAHDLRNPLGALMLNADVLLRAGDDAAVAAVAAGKIRRGSQELADRIDRLLALWGVGDLVVEPQPVDLTALAEAIAVRIDERAPERTVDWVVDDGLWAYADPVLIAVLLENLLDNAHKFAAGVARPRIRVGGCSAGAGLVSFFVADNGVGFEPAHRAIVFEPHVRLHGSAFPGTGLGLSTVARIAAAHGGSVRAEAAPGRGATFTFTLTDARASLGVA